MPAIPVGALPGVETILSPADVWSYMPRTLTQAAFVIEAALVGDSLTIQRGDTLSLSITGLGDISGRDSLYFALKNNLNLDTDAQALLLLEEAAGLTVLNGAAHATVADGSITIDDAVAGDITITIKPAATALLVPGDQLSASVEMIATGVITTLTQYTRTAEVSADVVRAAA